MGLFSRSIKTDAPTPTNDVAASIAPYPNSDGLYAVRNAYSYTASREEAMSIPTIAQRARNYLLFNRRHVPIILRDRSTGVRIDPPRVINTPDPRVPGSAIYVWTAEDILFTGFAYWRILELYADTFSS
jgi:hypothetical protein